MTKKQLIIDSAVELFSERGIEATSVQQITDHCGISKGAFYLSFKSKEELVTSVIEHFMNNIIMKVDQAVNATPNKEDKLLTYYVQTFTILSEYTSFAEILMKEKMAAISDDLIEKLHFFVALSNENLIKILFDVYGDQIKGKQFDLVMIINGMIQGYLSWIFEVRHPFDIVKLSQSLVEKTDLIATKSQLIFLEESAFIFTKYEQKPLQEYVDELQSMLDETNGTIEKESLLLLIEELKLVEPRTAIILGLLSNLNNNEKFDWIKFLIRKQLSTKKVTK